MEIFCDYCGNRIEEDEMDDRIWEHEPDCIQDATGWCDCDIELHDYCFPEWEKKQKGEKYNG